MGVGVGELFILGLIAILVLSGAVGFFVFIRIATAEDRERIANEEKAVDSTRDG